MKKTIMYMIVVVFVVSILFAGIGCKEEAVPAEKATEEVAEEAATEEVAEEAATEEAVQEKQSFKIGYNNAMKGIWALDFLENQASVATNAIGDQIFTVNHEGNIDKIVSDIEGIISKGIDGMLYFSAMDNMAPIISGKFEEAKIPFCVFDQLPSDETFEILENNPFYAGTIGEIDYNSGYEIGEYAVKLGLKKAALITSYKGNTCHESRVQGFTDVFTEAGGEVVEVVWNCMSKTDAIPITDDLLIAHPDIDCIYGTNSEWAVGAIDSLKNHPEAEVKVIGTDLDPSAIEALNNGTLEAANGGQWVNILITAALLHNNLIGHPILDENGKAPTFIVDMWLLTPELANFYQEWWLENSAYTAEEIQQLCYDWNPSVTYDDFVQTIENYSFEERMMKRLEEEKVTETELQNAGIIE